MISDFVNLAEYRALAQRLQTDDLRRILAVGENHLPNAPQDYQAFMRERLDAIRSVIESRGTIA